MPKSKAVVSVFLDIAALTWATRSINSKDEWAEWGQTFVEALATQTPELNAFAASLIQKVVDFRAEEAKRVRELREHSVQEPVHTERKKERKKLTLLPDSRPRNEIFDALAKNFFDGTPASSDGSRIGKQASILKERGATPEQLPAKIAAYKKAFPEAACTMEALVKHWPNLKAITTSPEDSLPPQLKNCSPALKERALGIIRSQGRPLDSDQIHHFTSTNL